MDILSKRPSINTVLLFIHSLFYVINLSSYLVILKLIETQFNYNNFWFNTLLSVVLAPTYFIWLTNPETRKRIRLYRKTIIFPILAGACYCLESILLYYSVNNLNLSYYTILRSSFIIWNIPFFIFFLKKRISPLYWISCFLLLVSYSFSIYFYISNYGDSWKPTIAIILSCIINSTYNNIIEHSLKQYHIQNIDYQLLFQNTYFILAIAPSTYFSIKNPPPINSQIVLYFFCVATMLQIYGYNKLAILRDNSNGRIPSNVLMSGLDLIRRFILLTFSFLMFDEPLNIYIVISMGLFIVSSILLFVDYIFPIKRNNTQQMEVEISEKDGEEQIELLP